MKYLLICLLFAVVTSVKGQWKQEYIARQLELANKIHTHKYVISHIEKNNNKWTVYYKIIPIDKYLCLFCGEYDCPAENCRRQLGVSFEFVDESTVKAIYSKGQVSAVEITKCSVYAQTTERIIKAKQYKIIY